MAQRVQVVLEDDLDGSEAVETVAFSLDGTEYEIDLSFDNAKAMRDALAPWVNAGRRIGGRRRRANASNTQPRQSGSSGADTGDVRSWAQANGYEVSSRGRVSGEVRDAYERAHS